MHSIRFYAVTLAVFMPSLAHGPTADLVRRRQDEIQRLLTSADMKEVTAIRNNCVMGSQAMVTERGRSAGLIEIPDVTDACVTALTRLGRSGALGYVRDPRSSNTTSANAFDNGYVAAYLKREAVPTGLPAMPALKATGERCLHGNEPDTDLCYSVGYAYGVRSVNGEVVRAQN